jgi:hypothetical protein
MQHGCKNKQTKNKGSWTKVNINSCITSKLLTYINGTIFNNILLTLMFQLTKSISVFPQVLFHEAVNCKDYILSVKDDCMGVEHWWKDTDEGKSKHLEKNQPCIHLRDNIYHITHTWEKRNKALLFLTLTVQKYVFNMQWCLTVLPCYSVFIIKPYKSNQHVGVVI